MQQRIDALLMVEEERERSQKKFSIDQQLVKKWFDKHKVGDKKFEIGDLVLKWNKINEPKGKHSKFQNLWLGPLQVAEKIGVGTYRLQNLMGELEALPINRPSPKMFLFISCLQDNFLYHSLPLFLFNFVLSDDFGVFNFLSFWFVFFCCDLIPFFILLF